MPSSPFTLPPSLLRWCRQSLLNLPLQLAQHRPRHFRLTPVVLAHDGQHVVRPEELQGASAVSNSGLAEREAARGHAHAASVPVDERTGQLALFFGTAEAATARAAATDGSAERGRPRPATRAVPKPRNKEKTAPSATMEEVTKRLREAFQNVAAMTATSCWNTSRENKTAIELFLAGIRALEGAVWQCIGDVKPMADKGMQFEKARRT